MVATVLWAPNIGIRVAFMEAVEKTISRQTSDGRVHLNKGSPNAGDIDRVQKTNRFVLIWYLVILLDYFS